MGHLIVRRMLRINRPTLPLAGGCQCGSCRYEVSAHPYVAYTCHCRECQKLTSSAFLTCMHVPAECLELSTGEPISKQRIADSGNTLTTYFCGACGSTLFIRNDARPHVRTVHVGSLDHPEQINVDAHIWVKRKLPWVTLPSDHRVFEGPGDWTQDYVSDPGRYGK